MAETGDRDLLKEVFGNYWNRRSGFSETGVHFRLKSASTTIDSFDRLIAQVMRCEPYTSARRVFWVVDNDSAHRGQRSIERLEGRYPNLRLIHLPVHSSRLNQIEIYFSIVQRKVLTPNDFTDLTEIVRRLLDFQQRYEQIAQPFEWKFTRKDLAMLMRRLGEKSLRSAA